MLVRTGLGVRRVETKGRKIERKAGPAICVGGWNYGGGREQGGLG